MTKDYAVRRSIVVSTDTASRQATRRRERAIVLDTVKAKPSVAAKEQPALTASPRDGRTDMRSGRKKASGGVDLKKCFVPLDGRRLGECTRVDNPDERDRWTESADWGYKRRGAGELDWRI